MLISQVEMKDASAILTAAGTIAAAAATAWAAFSARESALAARESANQWREQKLFDLSSEAILDTLQKTTDFYYEITTFRGIKTHTDNNKSFNKRWFSIPENEANDLRNELLNNIRSIDNKTKQAQSAINRARHTGHFCYDSNKEFNRIYKKYTEAAAQIIYDLKSDSLPRATHSDWDICFRPPGLIISFDPTEQEQTEELYDSFGDELHNSLNTIEYSYQIILKQLKMKET